eukprot:6826631-Karenia_brevis.AAC.1
MRLGGCGLRDSVRTSHAAYWASWADTIAVLHSRFPDHAGRMVGLLESIQTTADWHRVPPCLAFAEAAGRRCDREGGWRCRPAW